MVSTDLISLARCNSPRSRSEMTPTDGGSLIASAAMLMLVILNALVAVVQANLMIIDGWITNDDVG